MTKTLFVFPGQGSQYPGMGSDLHDLSTAAAQVYTEASDTLGFDMRKLCFETGNEDIHRTINTQPALLTHSMACLAALREQTGDVTADLAAGHSLGEYSALTFAGSLSFATALSLVRRRGELMGTLGGGEMMAIAMTRERVEPLASQTYCAVAGCNLPDQTVVGGLAGDLDALAELIIAIEPRKKPTRLKTEGAFHTYHMIEAAQVFREDLQNAPIQPPKSQVMSNYTGGCHEGTPDSIRSNLFWQLFSPVLWHANLMTAADLDTGCIVEFGGGIGSGETPATKRANLEGIIKKAYRRHPNSPKYFKVINVDTLHETGEQLAMHATS